VLKNKANHEAFLCDPSHRITFHQTPRHASRLTQIEIWFSILARTLLKRASFTSKDELKATIEAFIAYFNETHAKPVKWTGEASRSNSDRELGVDVSARVC